MEPLDIELVRVRARLVPEMLHPELRGKPYMDFANGGPTAAIAWAAQLSGHGIYLWRKQVRAGLMPGVTISEAGAAAFAPVAIIADTPAPTPVAPTSVERPHRGRRPAGLVEVRLVNGRTIRVDETIDPASLARIVAALDGVSE